VKYGITTMVDTCVTSENGVSTSTSNYLKEYYCVSDKRESEVYDCVNLGFEKCDNGACYGNATPSQQQQAVPEKSCGNKIVEKDKGENCDPPDKICFGKTTAQYGVCGADCKCLISASAEAPTVSCGDGYVEGSEECEEDEDCPDNHVCSSCNCVKQLTPEEIEAMKQQAATKKEEKQEEISQEIDDKYQAPETSEVDLSGENFSDSAGIKATSGISGFFKKIFAWIAGLFS